MRVVSIVVLLAVLSTAACSRLSDVIAYETSIERVSVAEATGPDIDTKPLSDARLQSALKSAGFTSFLWQHPETGVTEWYRSGRTARDTVNVKSVSKALFSALLGASRIDTSAHIPSFAGCATPKELKPLSFDVLMNMTAGFAFTENVSSGVYAAPSWGCRALELPREARSGTRFNYSTLQYHLAGIALSEIRNRDIANLLQTDVLGPIGVTLDGWVRNSDSDVFTGSEMRLHPRDMLRFGQLYLNDGVIQGRQVIPKAWVTKSREPQRRDTGRAGIRYSYGWWLTRIAGYDVQFAEGYGGQAIVIVPERAQIFVFTAPTGGWVGGAKHDARMARLLELVAQMLQ